MAVGDTTNANNNRSYVNDLSGTALFASQTGHTQRQLVVNGEMLGRYGQMVDADNPKDDKGNPIFKSSVDLSFGYQPISGNYPSASPGTYAVVAGDTLQGIAKGAYGDSSLWYLIAEANGLGGSDDLKVGQVLTIPTRVTSGNSANTFKPYDPTEVIGDTNPYMAPKPQGKGGCGGLGMIIMVVVAVVATIYTAGAAGAYFGAAGAAGGGGFAGGVAVLGGAGGAAGLGAAVVGGAVGSIVSQGVGVAIGAQDSFSWKGVALSAVGAGVGAGVSGMVSSGTDAFVNGAIRGAIGSIATQGIAVATGLQSSFSWKNVAASAVGAGVGSAVSGAVGSSFGTDDLGQFANRALSGFAGGLTTAALRGGRINVTQVAVDAFGNALGHSLAAANGQSSGVPAMIGADERASIMGMFDDGPSSNAALDYIARTPGQGMSSDGPTRSVAQQYVDTYGGEAMRTGSMTGVMPYGTSGRLAPDGPYVDLPETGTPTLPEIIVTAERDYDDGSYDASEAARLSNYPAPRSENSYTYPSIDFMAMTRASLEADKVAARNSIDARIANGPRLSARSPEVDFGRARTNIGMALAGTTVATAAALPTLAVASSGAGAVYSALGPWGTAAIGSVLGSGMDAAGQYYQNGSVRWEQSLFAGGVGAISGPVGATGKLATNVVLGAAGSALNTSFNNFYYQENNDVLFPTLLGAGFGTLGFYAGGMASRGVNYFSPEISYPNLIPQIPLLFQAPTISKIPSIAGVATGGAVSGVASFVPTPPYGNKK